MRISNARLLLPLAIALSSGLHVFHTDQSTQADPYKPQRRSKGEKARNRKNRGGRP